jgi:hypothetical protein
VFVEPAHGSAVFHESRFHEHDHVDSTALIDSTRFALVPV